MNKVQLTDDGRVLVVRVAPSTAAPGRWQLPGGSVEPPGDGEVLDEGALRGQAARELAEEIGAQVKPDELRLWVATRGENSSVGLTYLAPARPDAELRERFTTVVAKRAESREPELDEVALVRSSAELAGLAGPHVDYLEPIVRRYAVAPLLPGT
ncbi:NUDIX hydrolase [Streptomyces sp. NPDC057686]|uniref:NUDIX hydrolase n=1 Tax=Streptomyces sp. NPDC057686 TaxID=3346212 RepID=UPI0036A882C9